MTKYTSNLDVQALLADADLLKSMIGNLKCISREGARPIIHAITVRASQEPRLTVVPAAASMEILQILPTLVASDTYRATDEQIYAAWNAVDRAKQDALTAR